MNIVAAVFLIAVFFIQVITAKTRFDIRRSEFFGLIFFCLTLAVIFGSAAYSSVNQYRLWENSSLEKFFLPPYQDLNYFIFYARTRFFNPYLLSLFFGLIFLWAAKKLNKKYNGRFFEPIEPYLFATAIFSAGHPTWLFYLIALLLIFLVINILITNYHLLIIHKEIPRISLWYLWLPAGIFTILISKWLTTSLLWHTLKF